MNLARLVLAPTITVALVLASGHPARSAEPVTPSVQVVLPVVDGGITVVVAPGTTTPNAAPAPASTLPQGQPPAAAAESTAAPAPAPTTGPGAGTATETATGTLEPDGARPGSAAAAPPAPDTPSTWPPSTPAQPGPGTAPSTASPPGTRTFDLPSARPTYLSQGDTPASNAPALSSSPPTGRSGGPFRFGVFGHSTERAARFQEKVARPVEVLGVFPARGSWESIMDTWWLDRAPAGFTGVLDVGVPLWQEDGDLATAASGGYDQQWETLGRTIHDRYPGSSVRIGWEFNLGGWNHHATDENVEQWKEAFRRASTALKRGGPSLLVTWNPNKGRGDSLPDASKAWPGDDVVDIVGLDAYDWWPAYNETTWPEHRDGDQGWRYWLEFARTHGKQFALPEWGVAPGNDHGGGDNPYFVGVVMDFLAAEHAKDGIVHSAVYFDEPEGYIANSIADGQVPLAGAALASALADLGSAAPAAPAESSNLPHTSPPGSGAQSGSSTPTSTTSAAPSGSPPATPTPTGSPEALVAPEAPQAPEPSDAADDPDVPGVPGASGQESGDAWRSSDGHGPVPR